MNIDSISVAYCEESIHFTLRKGNIKAFIEVFDEECILNIFVEKKLVGGYGGSLSFIIKQLRKTLIH